MVHPNPRVGGGTDSDTWWVGGPNLQSNRRTKPASINARRPMDFKSAEKVESNCTGGLKENHHLGLEEDKAATITLTAWVREIRSFMEEHGMDTVFHVYDEMENTREVYLLKDWGAIDNYQLQKWILHL